MDLPEPLEQFEPQESISEEHTEEQASSCEIRSRMSLLASVTRYLLPVSEQIQPICLRLK